MRAKCLDLALRVTGNQRNPDVDKLAESFVEWAETPDHLTALTLAVEHRGRYESILDGAADYLKFIIKKPAARKPATKKPAAKKAEATTGQA